MKDDPLFGAFLTMTGVLLGIHASIGRVRFDWAEMALVAGAVLATMGISKIMKGGTDDAD